MIIEYSGNNSGGYFWLKKADLEALEANGWKRTNRSQGFKKDFPTPRAAMLEFEKLTNQKVTDEGCNCCGPPHCFSWEENGEYNICSGEDCLTYLFPDKEIPSSLREMLEDL